MFKCAPQYRQRLSKKEARPHKRVGAVKFHEALPSRGLQKFSLYLLKKIAKNGDDPLLKGTDIPLYRVAALVTDDGDTSRAKAAFTSLEEASIGNAVAYARLFPKKGRPYPSGSLKESLG